MSYSRGVHGPARFLGRQLAKFLAKPRRHYQRFTLQDEAMLRATLQPGDILLVEGETRMSTAIQYLTQSTWSHACFFAGPVYQEPSEEEPRVLIEADLVDGVIAVPLSKYAAHNSRICRPIGLRDCERQAVVDFMIQHIGLTYDLKNIFDLLRYLLPLPPIPHRYRRKLIAFGSGEPTKAICSSLIAQAFQSVRYPILPRYSADLLAQRHHTHFMPRDFDLSPYFSVVKPSLEHDFDPHSLRWKSEETSDLSGRNASDDSVGNQGSGTGAREETEG